MHNKTEKICLKPQINQMGNKQGVKCVSQGEFNFNVWEWGEVMKI